MSDNGIDYTKEVEKIMNTNLSAKESNGPSMEDAFKWVDKTPTPSKQQDTLRVGDASNTQVNNAVTDIVAQYRSFLKE